MNPYDFDPSDDFTIRQMEEMNRRTNQMDWINRIAREVNPYEEMARKLNPFDSLIRDMEQADRIKREIAQCAFPVTTTQVFDQRATSSFDSLIADQEALSRRINELTTPPSALSFPNISPPGITAPPVFTPPEIAPEYSMYWLNDLQIPIERIETHLPEFNFPEGRALTELQRMSDDEIRAFLDDNPSPIAVLTALHELMKRHLDRVTRPHWSVTWTFWLVLASVIIGAIGVIVGAIGVYLMLR